MRKNAAHNGRIQRRSIALVLYSGLLIAVLIAGYFIYRAHTAPKTIALQPPPEAHVSRSTSPEKPLPPPAVKPAPQSTTAPPSNQAPTPRKSSKTSMPNKPSPAVSPNPADVIVGDVPHPKTLHPLTDLFAAIRQRDVAAVRSMLAANRDLIYARNQKGATALHLACGLGSKFPRESLALVRLLVDAGAEINTACNGEFLTGQTPLHIAAGQGQVPVVTYLLAHGARVKAKDITDATPLHEAAIQGRKEVALLLLKHGADIEATQSDGYTPLTWAIISGHADVVSALLAKGANPNARAHDGTTPVRFAAMFGNDAIADLLRKRGGKE